MWEFLQKLGPFGFFIINMIFHLAYSNLFKITYEPSKTSELQALLLLHFK